MQLIQPRRTVSHGSRVLALTVVLAAASCLTACIDFVEPEIPEVGVPATLEVAVVLQEGRTLLVTAVLQPGFDGMGLPRAVADETLHVHGVPLQPVDRGSTGSLRYEAILPIAPAHVLGPIAIHAPVVAGTAPAPQPAWAGIRRAGPDTVALSPAGDLVLELEVASGGTAMIQQWFLDMHGSGGGVRLSADGPPPERLVVPAAWVPAPGTDGLVHATLTYMQSETRTNPSADYVIAAVLQVPVRWVAWPPPPLERATSILRAWQRPGPA
jgi:hypothetical protein